MKFVLISLFLAILPQLFLAILPQLVLADGAQRGVAVPKGKWEPFLKEYCLRCHGPEKQNEQVRFDEVDWIGKGVGQ